MKTSHGWVGLDIGGANLKAAHQDGVAVSKPFPLWERSAELPRALDDLLREVPPADRVAVTMTGELADCFRTKAEGVRHIIEAVNVVAGDRPVMVWQTGGEFLPVDVATECPTLVAAANWHALATWTAKLVPREAGLLLDIGSTTTDIIPLYAGAADSTGLTDLERLRSGELIYSGMRRTPICSVAKAVPFRDGMCPLAAEVFATMGDAHLITGGIASDADSFQTANGKPATLPEARQRLARMLCADTTEVNDDELNRIAEFLVDVQRQRLLGGIRQVVKACRDRRPGLLDTVVISGEGSWLGESIIETEPLLRGVGSIRLTERMSGEVSTAACAFAVARLAAERIGTIAPI